MAISIGFVAGLVISLSFFFGSNATVAHAEVASDIQIDGSATFTSINHATGERSLLWTVSCRQHLRSCVARSGETFLTLDENQQLNLSMFVQNSDRISISARNYTADRPFLFSRPLSIQDIDVLSAPEVQIVVEHRGSVVARVSVQGLAAVAHYLRWLNSEAAAAGRDARRYDQGGELYGSVAPPLAHLQDAEALYDQPAWQLVPHTKPQIEFAIRSQGGESFRAQD